VLARCEVPASQVAPDIGLGKLKLGKGEMIENNEIGSTGPITARRRGYAPTGKVSASMEIRPPLGRRMFVDH
jgi:hypothetical protein